MCVQFVHANVYNMCSVSRCDIPLVNALLQDKTELSYQLVLIKMYGMNQMNIFFSVLDNFLGNSFEVKH